MVLPQLPTTIFCLHVVLLIFISIPITITLSDLLPDSTANAHHDDNEYYHSSSDDDGFHKLVEWMTKEGGGRVNQDIQVGIRNGIRGIVSTSLLKEGDEILYCPWKLIIGSTSLQDQMTSSSKAGSTDNNNNNNRRMCQVVLDMAEEIRLGTSSLWFPYLSHIELPRLPATWDAAALEELQGLAPSQDAQRHVQWFQQHCNAGVNDNDNHNTIAMDQATMRSLVAFISRASEVGMVPIYDLLNHHNGKRNAKLKIENDGVHLYVVGGAIPKGEQLYLSYGVKTVATMYRDYGFVEEWPNIYNFQDTTSGDNFAFVMLPDNAVAINPTSQFLKGLWHANMPLVEYQASAQQHMESLSVEDFIRFAQAARTRLVEFPTTLQEDMKILKDKSKLLASRYHDYGDDTSFSYLQDVLSATHYRLAFKDALEKAAMSCEIIIAQRTEATGTMPEL